MTETKEIIYTKKHIMTTFTVFPNIKANNEGNSNPYIKDFIAAINNTPDCKVINPSHKNPLLSIITPKKWGDIIIFNWYESIPDFKHGYIQFFIAYILLICMKISKKKIIWVLHNKKPHAEKKELLKKILTSHIANLSDHIITHAEEGLEIIEKKFPSCSNKAHFIDHPTKNRMYLTKSDKEIVKKYDLLIWGSISKYKGVYDFIKYLNDNKINDLKVCVLGKCNSELLVNDIKSVSTPNTTLVLKSASFEELAEYISFSDFVLMPYKHDTILSSGTLMDTLSFGAKVIGPDTGSFSDYSKNNDLNVYVFNKFDDIKDIVKKHHDTKISEEGYSKFLEENNWNAFIRKAISLITSHQ